MLRPKGRAGDLERGFLRGGVQVRIQGVFSEDAVFKQALESGQVSTGRS